VRLSRISTLAAYSLFLLALTGMPAAAARTPGKTTSATKPAAAAKPAPPKPAATTDAHAVMPHKPGEPTRVAVLELSGLGIIDIPRNLEQYLRNSIGTIEGFLVLSATDVQMTLQDPKNRAIAACGGGVECASRTGKLVGADVVVIGSLTGLGDAFSLNLRAVDVVKAKELSRYLASVSGRDKLIPEVRLAAYSLVAPERIRGWLVVDLDIEGVEIVVDGKPVGTTPLAKPVDDLTPGTHTIEIKHPGYKPLSQQVEIRPFEPTRLTISLESSAGKP
jgi:hypothetical protein